MPLIETPQLPDSPPTQEVPPPPQPQPELPPRRKRRTAQKPEPLTATVETPKLPPTQEDIAMIAQALGVGFTVVFDILASSRGEHWRLSEQEVKGVAQPWAIALAPWLMESSKYLPLAIAALATVGVVAPRLRLDSELQTKQGDAPAVAGEATNATQ